MRIGILALQGNFALHQQALQRCDVETALITKPAQLEGLSGLIIPGGESTALLKLMAPFDWLFAIRHFVNAGNFLFGTCAGMILSAKSVTPSQSSLNLIDIDVSRNAYGRQLDSHVVMGNCESSILGISNLEMVFIRAPQVTRVGDDVQVLATSGGKHVLVQQDRVLCASFHPELSDDLSVHRYFVNCIQANHILNHSSV